MADAWKLYREEMSAVEREKIRDLLLTAKVNGFDEFLDVTMAITARIISGEIHPAVAQEARSYLELALTAITARAIQQGSVANGSMEARIAKVNRERSALPAPTVEVTIDATATPTVRASAEAPAWESKDG